ncbi:hypothetical protein MGWOODY_Mmi2144 [hydrothermal vent metagenome]|uniref:Uncharacterized protein n=1 Tax=hydrothermal vent metagenome TaxID=652676 RepID=A0A161K8G5_9ZZZZ
MSLICFLKYQSTGATKGMVYDLPINLPANEIVDQSLEI